MSNLVPRVAVYIELRVYSILIRKYIFRAHPTASHSFKPGAMHIPAGKSDNKIPIYWYNNYGLY